MCFETGRQSFSHKRFSDLQLARAGIFRGRVGEWLKPADCKSAAPCGLRRFESSPVHQFSVRESIGRETVTREVVRNKPQGNRKRRCSRAVRIAANWPPRKSAPQTAGGCLDGVAGGTGSAWVAQLVERVLGKDEVTGSIPVPGSSLRLGKLDFGRAERG